MAVAILQPLKSLLAELQASEQAGPLAVFAVVVLLGLAVVIRWGVLNRAAAHMHEGQRQSYLHACMLDHPLRKRESAKAGNQCIKNMATQHLAYLLSCYARRFLEPTAHRPPSCAGTSCGQP